MCTRGLACFITDFSMANGSHVVVFNTPRFLVVVEDILEWSLWKNIVESAKNT